MSFTLTRKSLLAGFGAAAALAIATFFIGISMAEDKPNQLAEGDKQFEEKSYRKAYEAYQAFLKDNPQSTEAFRIKLRMGHCQAQLGNYDKAETELVGLADSAGLTDLQRARASYRLGHFFADRPHYYYENSKGEKSWGNWQQDSEYHDVSRSDAEGAKNRLAKSAELLTPLGIKAIGELGTKGAEALALVDEAFNAQLDAAAALHTWQYQLNQKSVQVDYLDDDGQKQSWAIWSYEFPDRAEILKRHDEAVDLGKQLEQAATALLTQKREFSKDILQAINDGRAKGRNMSGLALYRRGCFMVSLAQIDDWDTMQVLYHPKMEAWDPLAGEYNPVPTFEKVYADYHDTPFADDAQYYIGYVYQQVGRHAEADKAYEKLINDKDFEKSTERISALYNLQQLRAQRAVVRTVVQDVAIEAKKEVKRWSNYAGWYWRDSVGSDRSLFKKEENLGLWVESRNVAKFELRVKTFNLPGLMKDRRFLDAHAAGMPSIGDDSLLPLIDGYIGEKVFSKEYSTGDEGQHKYTRLTFPLPERLPSGSYVAEIDTGGLVDRRLFTVSESQIVLQTYSPTENLLLFVDSNTGAPIGDSEVTYKRWKTWWEDNKILWRVDTSRYKTDAQGRVRIPTAGNSDWDGYLAYAENMGRHAFVQAGFQWWQRRGYNDYNRYDTRLFQMTDRPVYRPGDEIHGKIIMRQRDGGEWKNVAGGDFNLQVYNPRGEQKLNKNIRAGKFGTIEYDLPLDKDAALGSWYYYLRTASGNWLGSGNFQVEEYKKPEFEVSVSPPEKPVKLGEAISATIKGGYYFGGPTAGADVIYRVYRDFYFHSVYFPRRYDWLYNWQQPNWYGTPDQQFRRNSGSELVLEGNGKLNETGELVIEWNTQKALADWGEYDHQYRVEASVTDSSRRTIEGSGAVKALRRAFFAFVDNKLGFYRVGDFGDIEIRTVTADDKPVQAKGKLEIHKVTFTERMDEKTGMPRVDEQKTLVSTTDLNTNDMGLAFWREKMKESGTFDVVYRTQDEWGSEIAGSARIIVKADSWMPGSYRFGTLSLLAQQRVYTQGEKARVLLASDFRDAWMLVSVMGGREVISQSFVNLQEVAGQLELELTIGKEHVPNFHINVMTVRNGEVNTTTLELFVPPVDQFLNVEVSTDKPWYLPGDKGKATITAKDKDGKPVSAEFCVSVFDRSITYIMQDNTPNIMKHFYGDRRGYNLNYSNSYQTVVGTRLWDKQKYEPWRFYGAPLGWGVNNWLQWEKSAFDFNNPASKSDKFKQGFASDAATADKRQQEGQGSGGSAGKEEEKSGGLRERRNSRDDGPMDAAKGGELSDSDGGPGSPKPAAPAMEALKKDAKSKESNELGNLAETAHNEGAAVPKIRSSFKDSAFYSPSVVTGPDGTATIEFTFPDNLTDWRITVRGITREARVGEAFSNVKVTKKLILRDQEPRFFVEGDVVTISGIVMNRYDQAVAVKAMLTLNPMDNSTKDEINRFCGYELFPETPDSQSINVKANGEVRVDWMVRMTRSGLFRIRMAALSALESDATQKDFPCKVRGAELYQAVNAVINDGETSKGFEVNLPEKLDPEQTKLDLMLSPSVAALAMDAIPYLLEFPYGCVEQTMSRFLPAVVVRKTLQDAGISLEEIGKRRAQLAYDGTNPQAAYWYSHNPVFSTETMNAIIESGLKRLSIMQHGDGGWGWWQYGDSDTYMSAYVAYGLQTAKTAGVQFDYSMLDRGISFLSGEARREKNLHRAAYISWVLSYAGKPDKALLDQVYDRRDDLTHLSRSMICMAEFLAGDKERARILISNIEDYRKEDAKNGTVWWDGGQQYWWWWNDKIETNAFIMQAMVMVDPKNKFLDQHVRWLAQNRKGSRWNSTKDTSHAVSALMAFAKARGELSRTFSVSVKMDGKVIKTWDVTPQNIFALQTNLRLTGSQLTPGKHNFTVERTGEGKVYFSSFCSYFSKEDKLPATGNEIHIDRKYYKLVEKTVDVEITKTQPDGSVKKVIEKRKDYDRVPLEFGARLTSGDLIEVELGITADNDYEYLAFEDYKPAGCEPVALRSGQGFAGGLCQNVELRDDRVAFFVSHMNQGFARLKYQLRCEIPGTFSALPTQGGSMYVAEVRANSEEWKCTIVDKK